MFALPSNIPMGVKLLRGKELHALKGEAADLVPESPDAWGVECDQWCFEDMFLNVGVMLSLVLVMLALISYSLQQRISAASIAFAALCAAGVLLLAYFVANTLTRRVWFVFSPGKIGWLRKSYWGSEKRIFDCNDITVVYDEHPDGGSRDERSLNVELGSHERMILLYDGGKVGMSAWIAGLFKKAIASKT